MAVSTTDTYSGPYAANGVTVQFPFTFKAVSPGDVAVLLRDDLHAETLISEDDYSVTLTTVGGSVTFSEAPTSGDIFVVSEPAFIQSVEFASGQAFLPSVVNEVNDRDVVRALYLKGKIDRSFIVPLGESVGTLPPLAERAGKLALFAADGGLIGIDTLGVGNPDLQDDGIWSPDATLIDDGAWG